MIPNKKLSICCAAFVLASCGGAGSSDNDSRSFEDYTVEPDFAPLTITAQNIDRVAAVAAGMQGILLKLNAQEVAANLTSADESRTGLAAYALGEDDSDSDSDTVYDLDTAMGSVKGFPLKPNSQHPLFQAESRVNASKGYAAYESTYESTRVDNNCFEGEVSMVLSDEDANGRPSVGDIYLTRSQCIDVQYGPGYNANSKTAAAGDIVDAGLTYKESWGRQAHMISSLYGPLGSDSSNWGASMEVRYLGVASLLWNDAGQYADVESIDGNFAYEINHDALDNATSHRVSGTRMHLFLDGFAYLLKPTNGAVTYSQSIKENIIDRSLEISNSFAVNSSSFNGEVVVMQPTPFKYDSEMNLLSGGILTITGANNSKATITANGGKSFYVTIDSDGDGFPDEFLNTTWPFFTAEPTAIGEES